MLALNHRCFPSVKSLVSTAFLTAKLRNYLKSGRFLGLFSTPIAETAVLARIADLRPVEKL